MRKRTSRLLRNGIKDTAFGAIVFLMLPLVFTLLAHPTAKLSFDDAFAGEVIATRAIEVTAPPGPDAENAIVAVAQLRPAARPIQMQRTHDLFILGLTFSLLMSCNLAFWRHLRRVHASQRRTVGRKQA
ncbi:MAG: hypothetical protein AB7E81_23290 [Hyphomicrobiaceae bacterium]